MTTIKQGASIVALSAIIGTGCVVGDPDDSGPDTDTGGETAEEQTGQVSQAINSQPVFDFTNGCGSFPVWNDPGYAGFTGCKIAGTYTDATGHTFRIIDSSPGEPARVYWKATFTSNIDVGRLRFRGDIRPPSGGTLSAGGKITWKRRGASPAGRSNLKDLQFFSGSFNRIPLPVPDQTFTSKDFVELCPAGGCQTQRGNLYLTRTVTAHMNWAIASFGDPYPYPMAPVPGTSTSTTLLSGEINLPSMRALDVLMIGMAGNELGNW